MRKTTFPAFLSTAVICYIFWILISGELARIITGTPSVEVLIAGGVVSIGAALFSARFFIHNNAFHFWNPARLAILFVYVFVFLWELIKANVDVAVRAFRKEPEKSGIVKVPVDLKSEYALAMLADSITLTPGTITMDIVEQDGQTYFYVHCIEVPEGDPAAQGDAIKGTLEKWVRRIWE